VAGKQNQNGFEIILPDKLKAGIIRYLLLVHCICHRTVMAFQQWAVDNSFHKIYSGY
jgi:hypothetical protein